MKMSRDVRNNILITLIFTLLGAIIGAGFSVLMGKSGFPSSLIYGAVLGGGIAGLVTAFEFFIAETYLDRGPNRLQFWKAILLRTIIYSCIVVLCIFLLASWGGIIPCSFKDPDLLKSLVFFLLAIAAGNMILGLARRIGFFNIYRHIFGRYYNPHLEWRILMFLDITNSTTLAEEIGDVRFHALLTDIFETLSYVVDEYNGEVHDYVGDEMIATWPVRSRDANSEAVECAFACFDAIEKQADMLQQRHEVVPTFRIGMHLGSIVAGEVGGTKQTMVYVGDAMNTASRIVQACREEGVSFLVSRDVMNSVALTSGIVAKKLGARRLRGRSLPVELFALTRKNA